MQGFDFFQYKSLWNKFDLGLKQVKANQVSSFE